jgi:hypothetical protein
MRLYFILASTQDLFANHGMRGQASDLHKLYCRPHCAAWNEVRVSVLPQRPMPEVRIALQPRCCNAPWQHLRSMQVQVMVKGWDCVAI